MGLCVVLAGFLWGSSWNHHWQTRRLGDFCSEKSDSETLPRLIPEGPQGTTAETSLEDATQSNCSLPCNVRVSAKVLSRSKFLCNFRSRACWRHPRYDHNWICWHFEQRLAVWSVWSHLSCHLFDLSHRQRWPNHPGNLVWRCWWLSNAQGHGEKSGYRIRRFRVFTELFTLFNTFQYFSLFDFRFHCLRIRFHCLNWFEDVLSL